MMQVFPAMLRCNGLLWLNLFPLLHELALNTGGSEASR